MRNLTYARLKTGFTWHTQAFSLLCAKCIVGRAITLCARCFITEVSKPRIARTGKASNSIGASGINRTCTCDHAFVNV